MKLAFKDLTWTDDAPKSELEDWLRWHAFESECHILWSEVEVSELGSTPAIQLVRSLERALEKCRSIGTAEWDLFDLGWGFRLRSHGGRIRFKEDDERLHEVSIEDVDSAVLDAKGALMQAVSEAGNEVQAAVSRLLNPPTHKSSYDGGSKPQGSSF